MKLSELKRSAERVGEESRAALGLHDSNTGHFLKQIILQNEVIIAALIKLIEAIPYGVAVAEKMEEEDDLES